MNECNVHAHDITHVKHRYECTGYKSIDVCMYICKIFQFLWACCVHLPQTTQTAPCATPNRCTRARCRAFNRACYIKAHMRSPRTKSNIHHTHKHMHTPRPHDTHELYNGVTFAPRRRGTVTTTTKTHRHHKPTMRCVCYCAHARDRGRACAVI